MSGPGGVLALHIDPRVTGWAYGTHNEKPVSGIWRFPKTTDEGELGAAIFDAMGDCVKVNRPATLAITAPFLEGVDSEEAAKHAITVVGLTVCAKVYAYRRTIKTDVVSADAVRESILGRARFRTSQQADDAALHHCRQRAGWDVLHAPAAHSLVLWSYAAQRLGIARR